MSDARCTGPAGATPAEAAAAARGRPRPGRAGLRARRRARRRRRSPTSGCPRRRSTPTLLDGLRALRRRRARAHRPRDPACGTPAASPRPTCCGCAPATAPTPPTPSSAPADHDEVAAVVAWCSRAPRRAGAVRRRHVGRRRAGRPARRASPAWSRLDLRRLDAAGLASTPSLDDRGARGRACAAPRPRRCSAEHGLTLGHFPQSFEYASIGGFAATRSSGQASRRLRPLRRAGRRPHRGHPARHARARQRAGQRRRPRPARAGARLRGRVRRDHLGDRAGAAGCPAVKVYEGWRFDVVRRGRRRAAHARPVRAAADRAPALRRERDRDQPRRARRGRRRRARGGCLMIAGFEGDAGRGRPRRGPRSPRVLDRARRHARSARSRAARGPPAASTAPYLRDSMLDVGVLVETLETATFWSDLRAAVRRGDGRARRRRSATTRRWCSATSRTSTRPAASLYFTVAAQQARRRARAVGARPRPPPPTRSSPPAPRSPTTTRSARDHKPWLAAGDRPGRRRDAARGQGRARPDGGPQPRRPDPQVVLAANVMDRSTVARAALA